MEGAQIGVADEMIRWGYAMGRVPPLQSVMVDNGANGWPAASNLSDLNPAALRPRRLSEAFGILCL